MTAPSPPVRDAALAILSRLGVTDDAVARDGLAAGRRSPANRRGGPHRCRPRSALRWGGGGRLAAWRVVPPPRRGELVRRLGEELRDAQGRLGRLVTLEAGKILPEGLGEVQEMIDICDFAVGLSRQLYGLTIASERPDHRMIETVASARRRRRHHGLQLPGRGVGVERGAGARLRRPGGLEAVGEDAADRARAAGAVRRALRRFGDAPAGLVEVLIGGARRRRGAGRRSPRVPLVSATGSTRDGPRGRRQRWRARFGRSLLELGGNNAMIVAPSADLDLAAARDRFRRGGHRGQRCTTLRRLIVHESVARRRCVDRARAGLRASVTVGDPAQATARWSGR